MFAKVLYLSWIHGGGKSLAFIIALAFFLTSPAISAATITYCDLKNLSSGGTDRYEFNSVHKLVISAGSLYVHLNNGGRVVEYPLPITEIMVLDLKGQAYSIMRSGS